MKLTNNIRDAFVRAAMLDVPMVDYSETIRKEALRAVVDALPPAVRAVYEDPKTTDYVPRAHRTLGGIGVNVPGIEGRRWDNTTAKPELKASDKKLLDELKAKRDAQDTHRGELESKLKGAAYACTTRKALVDLLPEFERYLPADEAKATRTNLPVVANIVADFTKAGWPKGPKKGGAK